MGFCGGGIGRGGRWRDCKKDLQLAGGTACPTTAKQATTEWWDRRFRLSTPLIDAFLHAFTGAFAVYQFVEDR
jgi:hypothetical protein